MTILGSDPTRIVRLVESFTYDYSAICKLPTNRVERLYSGYATEIEKAVQSSRPKEITGNVLRIYSRFETELGKLRPLKRRIRSTL